jgi:poly(3-hydroxybutyrate) depolymerase
MFTRLVGGASKTSETRDGSAHARDRNRGGDLVIESWLVPGLGHAWSGGNPRATHTWPPGPSATDRILDFLLERS